MNHDTIRTEAERKKYAIEYCKERIAELKREISLCDYYENPYGIMEYCPSSYSDEKRYMNSVLSDWEKMLSILSDSLPRGF